MSIIKRKRNLVIAGFAVAAIIGAGSVAYAAFSSSTPASASGSAATLKPLSVDEGQTTVTFANGESGLWPDTDGHGNEPSSPNAGLHVATANVMISNQNEVGVTFSASDISGTATFDANSAKTTCDPYLGVTTVTLPNGPVTLNAHSGDYSVAITGVYLDAGAPNVCAGLPFTTNWKITAHQL
jgi:hypothetical protein